MKNDPKTTILYIYTWRLHRTFSIHKKERQNLQGLPGFLGQKKRTFGGKNQLFDHFSMGFNLKPLTTAIWTLKPSVWAEIDQKWSKNSKKSIKKPLFDPIFRFSRVPPLEIAKNRFSNMKFPLKMAKTFGSFDDFDDFFIFWCQNLILDPKTSKTSKKFYPPPVLMS